MNNTKINIKVHQLMGYKVLSDGISHDLERCGTNGAYLQKIPNYCDDLNAMRVAEQFLDDGNLFHGYVNRLWSEACPEAPQLGGLNAAIAIVLIRATAKQRAVAFIEAAKDYERNKEI